MLAEFTERDGEMIRIFRYKPETSVFFKTARQDVAILDTVLYGRTLFLDGILQSSERDEEMYHRMLVHTAMGTAGKTEMKNILILGGGEGATLREVLKWNTQKITMLDWDRELVEYFRDHEPTWHKGALNDSRVTLEYSDVFEAIQQQRRYGVILMDLVDPDMENEQWKGLVERLVDWLEPDGCLIVNAGGVFPWDSENASKIEACFKTLGGEKSSVIKYKKWIPSFGREWAFILLKKR
jgi:spermidine synthase